MAFGSAWARAAGKPTFIRHFSRHLLVLASWLPVVVWFNTHVAEVTAISGQSMYPYFNSNPNETLRRDWVLNYKLTSPESLKRGMIVMLRWVCLL